MSAQNRQNFTVFKAVTIAIVCFIMLLLIALCINLVRLWGLKKAEAQAQASLDEAIALSIELEKDRSYKSSAEYIERYAREYLNMKRKGEKVLSGVDK